MKKRILALILSVTLLTGLSATVMATDFTADENNAYTVEITGKTAGKEYVIIVVAGDYTGKEMPELSEENIIYINQVTADENGTISFTDFIPMTGSVGTVYIGGDTEASEEGVLMTDSGFGYIAGRLISYSGTDSTVTIPENFESIDAGAFENSTERVIIPNDTISINAKAFTENTTLFLSPISDTVKQFAIYNGYAYSVIGDYDGDKTVDFDDYKAVLYLFAKGGSVRENDLDIILDFDLDGSVTLNDASVLLKFLAESIMNPND